MRLISVAVPVPALGLLTYAVPDGTVTPPAGARVIVPLGTRRLTGIVLGEGAPVEGDIEIRELLDVLDPTTFLPDDAVELARWVADYYLAGPGSALSAALPPHALTARVDAFKTVRVASLTDRGRDAVDRLVTPRCAGEGDPARLGARQREALQILAASADELTVPALAEKGIGASTVSRLEAMELIAVRDARVERDPFVAGRHTATAAGG